MRPPRAPLHVSLSWAAAAHAGATAKRVAEERGAMWARLRTALPAAFLLVALVACGVRAWSAAGALPIARWALPSALAGLAPGTPVWVEGTVTPSPGHALADPIADQSVVAWSLDVRRSLQRAAYDASSQRLETRDLATASGAERDVECWIGDEGGRVKVHGFTPDPATSSILTWRTGQRVPAALARVSTAFAVVPGERLLSVEVSRARVREGDRVAVYGAVARDEQGQPALDPPPSGGVRLVHGGYSAWRQRLLEDLGPWSAATTACAIALLLWLRACFTRQPGGVIHD